MAYLSAALFACCAFAWNPPYLDRVGVAALAMAFLALAVGGRSRGRLPTLDLGEN